MWLKFDCVIRLAEPVELCYFKKFKTKIKLFSKFSEQGLRISLSYELELKAISGNDIQILDKRALSVQQWLKMAGRDGRSNEESVSFHYILLQGNYSIRFRLCDRDAHFDEHGCETESVESAPIPMNRSFANLEQSWCLTGNDLGSRPEVMKYEPVVAHGGINFSFAFTPCHKILPYEEAQISVFQQTSDNRSETCEEGFKILQSSVPVVQAHLVGQVDQSRIGKPTHQAVISYQVCWSELSNFLGATSWSNNAYEVTLLAIELFYFFLRNQSTNLSKFSNATLFWVHFKSYQTSQSKRMTKDFKNGIISHFLAKILYLETLKLVTLMIDSIIIEFDSS